MNLKSDDLAKYKKCPACEKRLLKAVVFCTECGHRFSGGHIHNPVMVIRKNMGMSAPEAIRRFAAVFRTKTEMAHQFGVSRNTLYAMINRYELHEVQFPGDRKDYAA